MSANAAGAPVAPAAVARLPRQVKLFGAVSLLNDFASEMIYPLLPALVTGVLGAGPQALGALDGAADFAAAFVKLGAGRLADRPASRGRLVVLGYAVAVLVLAVWAVRDGQGRTETDEVGRPSPSRPAFVRRRPPLALVAISLFYLLRMPDTLVILRSQQLGVSVAVVTLLWAALHVVRSTSSFLGGAWTDRLGAERTMWIGWVCYALLTAGMAYAHTTLQAWGLFLALGVVAGLTESPERALGARTAGARPGSGFGAYHGLTGFAALAGGLVLGGVFQAYG